MSDLEQDFIEWWRMLRGPRLTREVRFSAPRKWRLDFAHEPTKTAIECQGGIWSKGRHARGAGILADYEKFNAATLAGWQVFYLTREMLNEETLRPIIRFVRQGAAAKP
jgi:hypothetical protein